MKNPFRVARGLAFLTVKNKSHGFVGEARVDTDDLLRVARYRWFADFRRNGRFYVVANCPLDGRGRRKVYLHRLVLDAVPRTLVDHIDGDPLNNTRQNLRLVDYSQNGQNRRGARPDSKSQVRGVYWHKAAGKWAAEVKVRRKRYYLGLFSTLRDAEAAVVGGRKRLMTHSRECADFSCAVRRLV